MVFNITHRIAVIFFSDWNIPNDSIVSDSNVGTNLLPFQISFDREGMAVTWRSRTMRCEPEMEDAGMVDESVEVNTVGKLFPCPLCFL